MRIIDPDGKIVTIDFWGPTLKVMKKRRTRSLSAVLGKMKEDKDTIHRQEKIRDLYLGFQIDTEKMIRGLMGENVDLDNVEPRPYGEGAYKNLFLKNEHENWRQAARNLGYKVIYYNNTEMMKKIDIEVDNMRDNGTAKPGLRP